jgi:hypothetical protein
MQAARRAACMIVCFLFHSFLFTRGRFRFAIGMSWA